MEKVVYPKTKIEYYEFVSISQRRQIEKITQEHVQQNIKDAIETIINKKYEAWIEKVEKDRVSRTR